MISTQDDRSRSVTVAKATAWIIFASFAVSVSARADEPQSPPALKRADPDEPLRAEFSPQAAARAMDEAAADWRRVHGCVQCHANLMYLAARPALEKYLPTPPEARELHEQIVAHPKHHQRVRYKQVKTAGPEPIGSDAIVVAFGLAMHDRRTTGKLQPTTRAALDWMLSVQRESGDWYVVTDRPPDLFGTYTQTMLAAIAIDSAPDAYAETDAAKTALNRIRKFAATTKPATPYQIGMRLWAAANVPGLDEAEEVHADAKLLLNMQHKDGGWSIRAFLADDERFHFGKFAEGQPSDPFGTGFATFALRQAGVPSNDAQLTKAVTWLKSNQRESGRWFLKSLVNRLANVVSNSATYWAVMALDACEALLP